MALLPIHNKLTQAVNPELSENSLTFQKNLNEDKTVRYFTRAQLDGLAQDFVDGLEKVDQVKFTTGVFRNRLNTDCFLSTIFIRMERRSTKCLYDTPTSFQ